MVGGQPAPLGARAFDLLMALVERRDRTVTKNELLDLVWLQQSETHLFAGLRNAGIPEQ